MVTFTPTSVFNVCQTFSMLAERVDVQGEVLELMRISRTEMGAYLCIASNKVPPSMSKRIILTVECKIFICMDQRSSQC